MKMKLKTTKLLKCYSLTPIFIFLLLFSSFAQNNNFNLLGKVIDEKTQFPLGGATIEIKGAYHEVIAGNDGEFIIKTETKFPFILIVSYVGYESKEITVTNSEITVTNSQKVIVGLSETKNKELNEVVVMGYGTQRRKDVTGLSCNCSKR